jgi:hypothetical protein
VTGQSTVVIQSLYGGLSGAVLILILSPFIIMAVIYYYLRSVERAWRDRRAGVIEAWSELRLTKTELIEGYKKNSLRHPLNGLSAKVEVFQPGPGQTDADGDKPRAVVRLTIEGPHTAIVRSEPMYADTEGEARDFAAHVDLAGRSGTLDVA